MRAVLAAGVVGVVIVGGLIVTNSGDSTSGEAAPITLRAVSAEQRDLVEFTSLDGRMVYADAIAVTGATDTGAPDGGGTSAVSSMNVVTAVVADGDEVTRGTILFEINAAPVTVFYGHIPFYRELPEGAVGDDVLILEENLASLGYHTYEDENGDHIDTDFLVDGVFDAATTAAVVRWQADVGLELTGIVTPSRVVMVDGPSIVSDLAIEVGSAVNQGAPIMTLNAVGNVEAVYLQHSGEIELFVTPGTALTSGDIVYSVGKLPITAVVTDVDFDRDLAEGVETGDDVFAIEEMLVALGYDANGDLTVDDEFDEFTAESIIEWEEDLQITFEDVVVDGIVALGEIIIFEPGATVGTIAEYDTEVLASGSELWSNWIGSESRAVETSIAVADQDALAEGNVVDVEFPDGEVVQGTVTEVSTSSTIDPTNPDADPVLAVEIALPTVPDSVDRLNEVDVKVLLVEEIAVEATVVPVSALVATGDGAYAVEALTSDGGTLLVAVEPGMFSDGWVAVSGIQPGTQVVVPS